MLINPVIALIVSVGGIAALFTLLPPHRAVIAGYIGAWLFLPQAALSMPGMPDLTKSSAASLGIILGIICFDAGRIMRFRPSWIDIPALALVVAPMFASLTNGLGAYDGASTCLTQFVQWGVPYLVGRMYFDSLPAMRDVAIGVFIGGLVYIPLCLIEIRFSPQLHRWVYGYHQHEFIQTIRGGTFRPMVFMQHGLMVGMWMASATLVAGWLWYSGSLRKLFGVPMSVHTMVLGGITVLCKSYGALALLALGAAAIWCSARLRMALLVLSLLCIPPAYMYVRASDTWDGSQLVALAESISPDRAESLEYRLNAEALMTDHALERSWFGWGGWGRSVVYNEYGRRVAETDGLWIIALGTTGLFGLGALTLMLELPILLFIRRFKATYWRTPMIAPVAVLAMLLLLHTIDNLFNAMVNPTYIMIAGGLGSLALAYARGGAMTILAQRRMMMMRQAAMSQARMAGRTQSTQAGVDGSVRYQP